ncbi:C6 transcription factor [Lasiodiplodia theobromae]|uniref:C6 transcription factor n=1 Tax=Lasiodiplodia theobromae TaxID=45133 RepID=UPI0015C39866|nr:C6 transcription factor [Lasiodiplodia theobromae]KAF4537696.1 C6 transcription factor [Lasiodiplodia theobromae]
MDAAQGSFFANHWPNAAAAEQAERPRLKLRSACDFCHAAKVKCSGEPVCARCQSQELPCSYSYAMRAGKPRGSRNKKTLEKQARLRQQYAAASRTTPRNDDWQNTPLDPALWVDDASAGMDIDYFSADFTGGADKPSSPGPHAGFGTTAGTINPTGPDGFADVDPFLLADDVLTPPPEPIHAQMLRADREISEPGSSISSSSFSQNSSAQSCDCFDVQTANLSALHSLHRTLQSQSSACRRIDICVQRINAALTSCRDFLRCGRCPKDSFAVLLTISAFQLVLRLFEHLVAQRQQQSNSDSAMDTATGATVSSGNSTGVPPCLIGEYQVSEEEYTAIRTVLVRRALQKGEETLASLKSLAECSSPATPEAVQSPTNAGFGSPGNCLSPLSLVSRPPTATSGEAEDLKEKDKRCCADPARSSLSGADVVYLKQVICRSEAVLELFIRNVSRDLYII